MYDYHLHSSISMDGEEPFLALARAAGERGIKEICMTEHLDIHYGQKLEDADLDMEEYIRSFRAFQAASPVPAKFGIELGLAKGLVGEYERFYRTYHDFDFVICSQHIVDGSDPFYHDFYDTRDFSTIYEVYLKEILDSITAFKEYDVIGHIGYVARYHGGYQKRAFNYAVAPDLIDEILKLVIEEGKGIEINTSKMDTPVGSQPAADILRRYKELGGEIITTGSDAHQAYRVANCFKEAYELLKNLGFKYVCTYHKRAVSFHKI